MEDKEILVLTSYSPSTRGEQNIAKKIKKNSIKLDKLSSEINELKSSILKIFDEKDENPKSAFFLDEISLHAEITTEGKVGILGIGSSIGASGGISLKFKRTTK